MKVLKWSHFTHKFNAFHGLPFQKGGRWSQSWGNIRCLGWRGELNPARQTGFEDNLIKGKVTISACTSKPAFAEAPCSWFFGNFSPVLNSFLFLLAVELKKTQNINKALENENALHLRVCRAVFRGELPSLFLYSGPAEPVRLVRPTFELGRIIFLFNKISVNSLKPKVYTIIRWNLLNK